MALIGLAAWVDVAGRLAGLFEVFLRDLARRVGVDYQDFRLFEAEVRSFPEILADRIGELALFDHHKQPGLVSRRWYVSKCSFHRCTAARIQKANLSHTFSLVMSSGS